LDTDATAVDPKRAFPIGTRYGRNPRMSGPSEPADLRLPEDARQQVRDRVEETFERIPGKEISCLNCGFFRR
jgi:hypothetical protein